MHRRHLQPASAPITRLNLALIRTDAGTQSRAGTDESTVSEYAEAMIRGGTFPAVRVSFDGHTHFLADGFHRVKARRLARFTWVDAELRRGSRLDAVRASLAANHQHGLRRSNKDKQQAVTVALKEFSELSDEAIADLVGVSQPTVSSVRRQRKNF